MDRVRYRTTPVSASRPGTVNRTHVGRMASVTACEYSPGACSKTGATTGGWGREVPNIRASMAAHRPDSRTQRWRMFIVFPTKCEALPSMGSWHHAESERTGKGLIPPRNAGPPETPGRALDAEGGRRPGRSATTRGRADSRHLPAHPETSGAYEVSGTGAGFSKMWAKSCPLRPMHGAIA